MSRPLGTYSFLPWLRQGLANRITAADLDAAVKLRATVRVDLELSGNGVDGTTVTQTVGRDVALYSPGDIVGIVTRAIVRVEPRNWITDFEPNYLPQIEFYDDDFAYRYTPAAPGGHRLRPWIMLAVLAEGEFEDGQDIRGKALPYIEVADPNVFPPADQLWAWVHVHVNRGLAASDAEFTSNDMGAVLPRFQAVLNESPDLAYSRICSPRKLAPNTAYHAFLVPVFETGRLAGLGLDPAGSPHATFSAWAAYPAGTKPQGQSFPYYYRWFFRTGEVGDFESLVRLLKPKPVDTRVGTRDMDVQTPGSNLPGITEADLHGILKLGGALRVPRENYTPEELVVVDRYENWATPYPRPFQESLATLINLTDDYATAAADAANAASGLGADVENDPDPLITPPLYGTWHALTKRLLRDADGNPLPNNQNWVHELNLDPRFRVAAGFGTRVVQDQQESLMDSAWEQLGKVLEANQRIRLAQLAKETAFIWHSRHLQPLLSARLERAFFLTTPVHRRVLIDGQTVRHQQSLSLVPPALTSAAMRRAVRPGGRLARSVTYQGGIRPDNLLTRANDGQVSAAPPKTTPPGAVTVDQVAGEVMPKGIPDALVDLLRRNPWLRFLPLILALLIIVIALFFGPAAIAAAVALAGVLFAVYRRLTTWTNAIQGADAIREESQTPDSVAALPTSPDFVLSDPGAGVTPKTGATDSVEASRFKGALRDVYTLIDATAKASVVPPKTRLNLPGLAIGVVDRINPERTVPKRTWQGILIPERIRLQLTEQFVEAMAYPEFDIPMYEPLKNISAELFLPNINLIEQNSITLLETNQKFIEAYMVGLNHEFARELLWREYPTDQRGSYFRQFWDVAGVFNAENLDAETLRERLRDIPPLDRWSRSSALGDHDNRELAGDKEEEVVLVIRGELLKRYPTAVIYAHRARWQKKADGSIDNQKERDLEELSDAEESSPPRTKVRTPLYEAKVDPDIYFFGFDLTAAAAKGGTGENPDDDPGWFFVIKERPGEPRFGLDIEKAPKLNTWSDLAWPDIQAGPPGSFIQITNATPMLALVKPTDPADAEKLPQYEDDKNVSWNKDMSAADVAYVLFQAPVLVAVHAAEMLTRK